MATVRFDRARVRSYDQNEAPVSINTSSLCLAATQQNYSHRTQPKGAAIPDPPLCPTEERSADESLSITFTLVSDSSKENVPRLQNIQRLSLASTKRSGQHYVAVSAARDARELSANQARGSALRHCLRPATSVIVRGQISNVAIKEEQPKQEIAQSEMQRTNRETVSDAKVSNTPSSLAIPTLPVQAPPPSPKWDFATSAGVGILATMSDLLTSLDFSSGISTFPKSPATAATPQNSPAPFGNALNEVYTTATAPPSSSIAPLSQHAMTGPIDPYTVFAGAAVDGRVEEEAESISLDAGSKSLPARWWLPSWFQSQSASKGLNDDSTELAPAFLRILQMREHANAVSYGRADTASSRMKRLDDWSPLLTLGEGEVSPGSRVAKLAFMVDRLDAISHDKRIMLQETLYLCEQITTVAEEMLELHDMFVEVTELAAETFPRNMVGCHCPSAIDSTNMLPMNASRQAIEVARSVSSLYSSLAESAGSGIHTGMKPPQAQHSQHSPVQGCDHGGGDAVAMEKAFQSAQNLIRALPSPITSPTVPMEPEPMLLKRGPAVQMRAVPPKHAPLSHPVQDTTGIRPVPQANQNSSIVEEMFLEDIPLG